MHPFCCISAVSDHKPSSPFPMSSSSSSATASRSDLSVRSLNHNNGHKNQNNHHNHVKWTEQSQSQSQSRNQDRSCQRSTTPVIASESSPLSAVSRLPSLREQPVVVDMKINNIVSNGISGMLYKWVNYGKGWRPRWFVLQDGVLSYYKIHGPDKIVVNQETEKGSKVIGEESRRRTLRPSNGRQSHQRLRKPFGEIHLKTHLPL